MSVDVVRVFRVACAGGELGLKRRFGVVGCGARLCASTVSFLVSSSLGISLVGCKLGLDKLGMRPRARDACWEWVRGGWDY